MQAERIIAIEYVGKRRSLDITLNNTHHCFYGNGIVTSNSHGVSYALLGYQTAYVKANFPLQFYCSWLTYAKEKIDPQKEVKELVSDAKNNGIAICVPNFKYYANKDFTIIDNKIYFGLRNIKRIGDSHVNKIIEIVPIIEKQINKKVDSWSWYDFLIFFAPTQSKTVIQNVILAGALDYMNISRKSMLYEYNVLLELTNKEIGLLQTNTTMSIRQGLINIKEKLITNRQSVVDSLIKTLENPTSSLLDTPLWINKTEIDLLGVAISSRNLDCVEVIEADTTCKEYNDGKKGEILLCVEIVECRENKIKKGKSAGQSMAFLVVEDETGTIDNVVVFSKEFEEYQTMLYNGNIVAISGYRSKQDSLVINKIRQL